MSGHAARTSARATNSILVACVILAAIALAQTEFEVASIRPSKLGTPTTYGAGNGGAGGANVTLKMLISFAYRLQVYQVVGGPGWVGSDRYDIEAKAADRKADPDQLRLMLQALSADRFRLRLHRQTKQAPVYALVVAKGGPKIKLSADQTSPEVNGPSAPGAGPNRGAIRMISGSVTGNAATLAFFTTMLSQRLDRPVVDRTNLAGRFDIQLRWTPDVGENPQSLSGYPVPSAPEDSSLPSIFVAIQEQLGLKLEAAKGPVEFLFIDHIERPSEN